MCVNIFIMDRIKTNIAGGFTGDYLTVKFAETNKRLEIVFSLSQWMNVQGPLFALLAVDHCDILNSCPEDEPMMPNEECLDAAADESLLETSPIQSPLQVFAGMGGLALIAERLPMLYPDVIQQVKLSAFKRHRKLEIEQLAYIQQFFSINFLFHNKCFELTCSGSSALMKSLVCLLNSPVSIVLHFTPSRSLYSSLRLFTGQRSCGSLQHTGEAQGQRPV